MDSPDAVVALDTDVVLLEAAVPHADPPGEYLADVLLSVTAAPAEVSVLGRAVHPDGPELIGFVLNCLQCFIVESRS